MLEAGAEVVHDGIGPRGAVVMVAVENLKIIPGFKVAQLRLEAPDLEAEAPRNYLTPCFPSLPSAGQPMPGHTARRH